MYYSIIILSNRYEIIRKGSKNKMSNNINYPSNFYINNNSDNSNEKYIYENNQLNNQNYSPNKDKDFQAYTTVSLNQQPPSQSQLPPPQHLPNINNMLNYEPDIRDDNDNMKKPKLRKTFYKLPSNVSYRMKNKNYVGNCPNMNSNGNNGNMNVCKYLITNIIIVMIINAIHSDILMLYIYFINEIIFYILFILK